MKSARKLKPETVRAMALRRGLSVFRARYGGWIVSDVFNGALYATHDWTRAKAFIKNQPTLRK